MQASELTEDAIARWRVRLEECRADQLWVQFWEQRKASRAQVRTELLSLLNKFLNDQLSVEVFRSIFHLKTAKEWDVFGLKGFSGAMFLNMLVKYIPPEEGLPDKLRFAIRVPASAAEAQEKLDGFMSYLLDLNERAVWKGQRMRGIFFLTALWHQQDPETWPAYYPSVRDCLRADGLVQPNQNAIAEYFAMRETVLALQHALRITSWDLEGVCIWLQERAAKPSLPIPPVHDQIGVPKEDGGGQQKAPPESVSPEEVGINHTQVQWLLATIGRHLGCNVWIAKNDWAKTWNNEHLQNLSLKQLPQLGLGITAQRDIQLIDVLWLKGTHQVVAAFEVEHSTSIYSGLLRMSDLVVQVPNLSFPLYVVVPENRINDVRKQLRRPTFQALEIHRRCGFFSAEELLREADGIMKYGSGPSTIDKLAERVPDVMEDQIA